MSTDALAVSVAGPTETVEPTTRWGPFGSRPVRVLALVAFVDAADRGVLPGVLTRVQDDLGFSDTKAGLLGTAFVISGLLVVLPAGYLADRGRRTRLIAGVIASWGAISALNGVVRSYGQFLAVRASLGAGETLNNPLSGSLLADYYPPSARGRAFAIQRISPVVGMAVGTGMAGLVGALVGWRWAFVLVGVPGSLLALWVLRLPEPARGGSDLVDGVEPSSTMAARDRGASAFARDVREVASIGALRSLMVGLAVALGALAGIGFWLPAFYERQYGLSSGAAAGITGALVLVGALGGSWAGGIATDRLRSRYRAAPMLVGGGAQLVGGCLLFVGFSPVPLAVHVPVQLVAVALIAGGLPALTVMVTEVVPAGLRGTAFSLNGFVNAVTSATSPLVIGLIADRFPIVVDGQEKGHLGTAFLIVTVLVPLGASVVLLGRRRFAMTP